MARASTVKGPNADINLHVFSEACPEIARTLRFRDWLRDHEDDRELYSRTKIALAKRSWTDVDAYARAKTDVIQAILARAERAV